MKKSSTFALVISLLLAVVAISVFAWLAVPEAAQWKINLVYGVTDNTHEIWNLHMMMFWICAVIGAGVFAVMLYSVIRHRKSRGFEAATFHENTAVEIIWTIIPFVILLAVAIPAAGTLLRVEDSSNPDLTIRVTGYQWLWEYEYVDSGVHFYSRLSDSSMRVRGLKSVSPGDVDDYLLSVTNRVVVPVDKRVRLLLTSGDVIHSWWVPALNGKKDAIPGYINDIWFEAKKTGVYRGQCAELCGRGHAFMPIVVEVVPQDEFKAWVAKKTGGDKAKAEQQQAAAAPETEPTATGSQQATPDGQQDGNDSAAAQTGEDAAAQSGNKTQSASGDDAGKLGKSELMALGEKVYANRCVACHKADGSGMPSAGFPALTGSPIATGPAKTHIARVLHGSGAMPPFANTLSDKQIAAVVTYERNALGNSTGDVVQPTAVASQR